jgi:hypothetical protein
MNIVRDTDKTMDTDIDMDMDMKSLNGHYTANKLRGVDNVKILK